MSRPTRGTTLRTVILGLAGLALFAGLLRYVGLDEVRNNLRAADPVLLGAAAVLFFTQILTMGGRWWIAMRLLGIHASLLAVIRANCGSNFVNFYAPGHFGEPMMAVWLGRTKGAPGVEAFTVLIACKVVATVMNLGLLLFCLPFLAGMGADSLLWQVGATIVFICVGTAAGVFVVIHRASAERLGALAVRVSVSVAHRLRPGAAGSVQHFVEKLVGTFTSTFALFARDPRTLVAVAAMSAFKMATIIGVVMLLYRAFDVPVSWFGATFLETVDVLGHLVSIWIPGNMGVQEWIMTSAAHVGLNIDEGVAASAAIAHKGILLIHITLGGALFAGLGLFVRNETQDPGDGSTGSSQAAKGS